MLKMFVLPGLAISSTVFGGEIDSMYFRLTLAFALLPKKEGSWVSCIIALCLTFLFNTAHAIDKPSRKGIHKGPKPFCKTAMARPSISTPSIPDMVAYWRKKHPARNKSDRLLLGSSPDGRILVKLKAPPGRAFWLYIYDQTTGARKVIWKTVGGSTDYKVEFNSDGSAFAVFLKVYTLMHLNNPPGEPKFYENNYGDLLIFSSAGKKITEISQEGYGIASVQWDGNYKLRYTLEKGRSQDTLTPEDWDHIANTSGSYTRLEPHEIKQGEVIFGNEASKKY